MRSLMLPNMNIHEIPECFQNLRELRYLYLSGNYLTAAPQALRGLPELRGFVAFRQGEYTTCHLSRSPVPSNLKERSRLKEVYGDCKLIWETKVGLDHPSFESSEDDDKDNPRVVCPWVSLRGSMQDWLDLRWPKIEKVWLDGNFISGAIPEDLPQAWPHLRSLDLYNNNLTGHIPHSLAERPWVQLQLQDNKLSGPVPAALFRSGSCNFNIAFNDNLTGCIPRDAYREPEGHDGFVRTKVRQCQSGAHSAEL
mmetsp:Transcript_47189/g.95253  ORF Transcript_47189/g.95253 Transcript_47189/m.95253 type:complete len:253 (-) Transcript_47189:125-883(-)